MSPSTAGNTGWPARKGRRRGCCNLAEGFESRIEGLRGKFGEIGDARLTVMAALTVVR